MLPYTPLHLLLLEAVGRPLVMTSGNASDEPIATGNDEARARLAGIADGFLLHDREIVARYDDSVVRVVDGAPVFLRRARGYAPMPIDLPVRASQTILAVGPHLKNTFTILEDNRAYVSQHIGDLETIETVQHWQDSLDRFRKLFRLEPTAVVHDLHPGYLSTRLAFESGLEILEPVQHHHAHIAAVMAEHQRTDPVIGVAYDGTGYGDDGAVWGAEVMVADLRSYHRAGHLRYVRLPGGDAAARSPWRCAVGYLSQDVDARASFERAFDGIEARAVDMADRQAFRGLNSPVASSMGRLFDAAAAVLGVRRTAHYEGQAAMELESLAGELEGDLLPFRIVTMPDATLELDPLPALMALGQQVQEGISIPWLAASFHRTIVHATSEVVLHVGSASGIRVVALGGGCFQNGRLTSGLTSALEGHGLTVLRARLLSPNDGAVSVGQAAVAAARMGYSAGAGHLISGWGG
jgi:hydrogenase maturation protein HypF